MAEDPKSPERFSLSRWSRRKLEAARTAPAAPVVVTPPVVTPVPDATAQAPDPAPAAVPVAERPPVDTLTFESDFGAFLKPEVDQATQRAALKKLFSDPRFNVMDGLDTYIGDYTQADPMPAGMLDKLAKVYALLKEDPQASVAQSAKVEATPETAAPADARAIESAPPAAEVPSPAPPIPVTSEKTE